MANTRIQHKRSSVAGKTPNTTTLSIGELAINLTDKKIYSSDGTNIFEPAGNVTNLNVTAGIKANGSYGTAGQVLATNGSAVYWTADQGANAITANSLTANLITITTGTLTVGNSTVNTDIGNNYVSVGNSSSFVNVYSSYISIGNTSTTDSSQANSSSIILGNVTQSATETNTVFISSKLLQNRTHATLETGLGAAIALGHPGWNGPGGKVNFAPQGTVYATTANLFFVNTSFMQMGNSTAYFNMTPRSLTIGNTIVNSSLISTTALRANGSLGTAGQVLATNGTAIYWTADQGANAITANSLTANLITITTGTLSVGNSTVNTDIGNNYISVGNTSGFVNVYSDRIYIGNSTANAIINSTIYTGTANNANYLGGVHSSGYQTLNGLSGNVATLTANNANYLGTVAAAAYVQNTDSRTLSGNLVFSAANVAFTGNVRLNGVIANGSLGTAGQVLSSNGSAVYWAPASSGGSSVNTTPSNIKNIVNTSVGITQSVIDTTAATGISTIEYLISARDNTNLNYKSSRVLITTDGTSSFVTEYGMVLSNNSAQVCSFDSDINTGNIRLLATGDSADVDVSLQRVVLGSSTEAGDIAAAPVLDSVTNTSNIIAASANSVKTAYDVGIAGQTSAAAAYTNAVSYTDTKAAAAYSNATSYADTKAAAAYSNATSYADSRIIDSVTNTSITYAASANSVKNAYDRAIDANTRASSAQTSATDAYSNAIIFASNASNINTGTLAEARLPYRMNQNVQTTDTVEFAGLTLSGNLVVSGNVNIIGANNLSISDNMIYLNSNNDVSNPDLGFAGNYNDGTYHHAGFFRDASDGIWKVFDNYEPEPDASAFIDTTNTTFHIADFQTNTLFASSLSANGSLGTAGQVLTSNGTTLYWSTVSGGAGGFTNGQSISVNNFVITGAFSANSSNGTSGQVLTSNGTGTYWSTVSSSGNTGTTVVGSTQHSGSNSGIFIPATSQLEFGAGDFTIELFWYPISTGRQALYTGSVGTDYSIGIDYNSVGTNKLGIWASSTGTSWNIINADGGGNGIGTTTVPQNQWNHIAYTRSGSTWRLFLNGVPEVSVTSSATIVSRSAASKVIGQWFSATAMAPASGFISNFRAVKGVAVYTSAFTVPSLPLSVIANTVLLTAESVPPRDRSTNNLAVTGNNLTFATYSTSNVNIGITTGKAIAMALVFGG